MKLYYATGACSLAPHIALEEIGLRYEAVPVDLKAKTVRGGDYRKINPKGAVPALELDSGEILTENAVVLQYIADQRPEAGLLPKGGLERYRALEWLNFIATELHKGFGPLWNPKSPDESKHLAREMLAAKFDYVASRLGTQDYLMGTSVTLPDFYLTVMLGWTRMHQIDLSRWPALTAYAERMRSRPAVTRAMQAEGLLR
jgi:glutathione S-transferase